MFISTFFVIAFKDKKLKKKIYNNKFEDKQSVSSCWLIKKKRILEMKQKTLL